MKTSKEMAKEYIEQEQLEYEEASGAYYGFVAGYQAAQDQLADTSKVINSSKKLESWISVKDRLPEHSVNVLTFEAGIYKVNAVSNYSQWWWDSDEGFERNPSHWQPLPEPPKEEK